MDSPTASTTLFQWTDIKPGDIITVKPTTVMRTFRMVVRRIDVEPGFHYGFVIGQRLTAAGKPSRLRTHTGQREGERQEFFSIRAVMAIQHKCVDCDAPAVTEHQRGGQREGQPGPKCERHAGPHRHLGGRPIID